MQFGHTQSASPFQQSASNARGPLIAVIKIQIDQTRTDRIFLHQNDDDYQIAVQFAHKHLLAHHLIALIHNKIQFSRQSMQETSPTPSHNQTGTPYQNLQSWRQLQREVSKEPFKYKEDVWPKQNQLFEPYAEKQLHSFEQPPTNTNKQFKLYDQSPKKQHLPASENTLSNTQFHKIQLILQTKEYQQTANNQQLNHKPSEINYKIIENISLGQSGKSEGSLAGKIKIIGKQQIASLHSSLGRSDSKQRLSRSLSKQDINRINKEVTNRLYNEAQIKKNYLKIIKEKAKKEQECKNDPQLTHRPSINKLSKIIAEGRKQPRTKVEEHLIQTGKDIEVKRQEKAKIKRLSELEECSFQPTLNIISQRLNAEREKMNQSTKCRKSHNEDENMFKPLVNPISIALMKDKGSFSKRQQDYLQQKNLHLMQKVKQQQFMEKYDTLSGQELFKPKINDMGLREQLGSHIGQYLYQKSKESRAVSVTEGATVKISQNSQKLVRDMYLRRISWLFSELDSDQDGRISAHCIDIGGIEGELLNIIKPILFQMEELGESLTLMQFKAAVECLHSKLNANQKSILYNYKQPKHIRC